MDVIPLEASLVKGSHGVRPADRRVWPLIAAPESGPRLSSGLSSPDLYTIIKNAVLDTHYTKGG